MSLGRSRADPATKPSSYSRQWPGERHPTRWDVHDANESPAVAFLERFRVALLHSEGAEEEELLDSASATDDTEILSSTTDHNQFTYPWALLYHIPDVPPGDELERLQEAFFTSFKPHIFIDIVDITDTSDIIPPYLQLALASISSVTSVRMTTSEYPVGSGKTPAETSAGLFVAGANLWSVMLEVDNREARLLEAVVAASLLITYGVLSADRKHWLLASGLLANVSTITRRLHLTDSYPLRFESGEISEREFSRTSSLVSYMLLTDIMHAVHCNAVPNWSTSELFIRMPSTNHEFRTVYNSLAHNYALPQDVKSSEDSLVLLTALLSDIIYMQRCQPSVPLLSDRDGDQLRNPYAPLSSKSEFGRLGSDMTAALSRWENHFQDKVGSNILALCYFTKLYLVCPALLELPSIAGYGEVSGFNQKQIKSKQIEIPDEAMDLAWLVLDQCDKSSKSIKQHLSIWLPNVLFMSALVVWQRLRSQAATDLKFGTLKVLSMFKNEIDRLPWPCCAEMTKTLDRLMQN